MIEGNNVLKQRKYYLGNYEVEEKSDGSKRMLHYIGGESGTAAVYVLHSTGEDTLYSVFTDHLGSWKTVVNETDGQISRQSFDAWGRKRNPQNWNSSVSSAFPFDRGYTGHQHLKYFGLINMNGRMYDVGLCRFLSPDPYVQAPDFTQNFNRYSYCLNNPLVYTDPSGEWIGVDDLIAAGIGGVANLVANGINGNLKGECFWGTVGRCAASFGSGAVSGTLALYGPGGWAAGGAITGATNAWLGGGTTFQDIASGTITGAVSGIAGGAVGQYAATGLGSLVINSFNVSSPVVKGVIGGALGGAAGGYAGGFAGNFLYTGDFSSAHTAGLSGIVTGAALGTFAGSIGGYAAAKDANINPWTGKAKHSVTIGEGMTTNPAKGWLGVDKIAEDLGADYYKPDPEIPINAGKNNTTTELMYDNAVWIEMQMQQTVIIYDRGSIGNNSQYYNMEVGRTMDYSNLYRVKAMYNQTQTIRVLIIFK